MEYKKENLGENKVKLTIDVEKDVIAKASDEVYKKLAKDVKVAGFRPGKAPKNIVEKEVGTERFNAEILDIVIPQAYYEAIIKDELNVVGAPEVKVVKFVPTDGLNFEATVDVMPEVKVPDISKIKVKRQPIKIEDKEIQEVIDDLAKQLSQPKAVERAAKKGDRVEINFEGFVDNVPFEGGKSENYPLVLGSGQFIPGFEEQLEGLKVEDEKDVVVTFPAEYHSTDLAGKEATFKGKVNGVEELVMPEITDAFAAQVGPFKNLDALKTDIRTQLEGTKIRQERKRVEDEILEEMVKKTNIAVPEVLAHQEAHRLIHEAEQNLAYSGMTLEKYFEMTKTTQADLEEQVKPEAEKRVKVGLLLTEIAKEQKFDVSDKDLSEAVEKQLANVPEEQKSEAKEYFESHEGKHQLENAIIGQKVMDYLYENHSK